MQENKKRTKQIKISVNENEYEIIKKGAEISQKTISAYVREVALYQCVLHFNYDEIETHSREISEVKQGINRLIYTLIKSQNYYSEDIENLLEMLKKIYESEKILIKTVQKSRAFLHQKLKKIVKENIEKLTKEKQK